MQDKSYTLHFPNLSFDIFQGNVAGIRVNDVLTANVGSAAVWGQPGAVASSTVVCSWAQPSPCNQGVELSV